MTAPAVAATVRSADGASIALFRYGAGDGPPVLLVHGTIADHTTFRAVWPLLGQRLDVWAMDRRGRGASGDGPVYAIEREFEDVALAAEQIAAIVGRPITVVGHSYGGRCALGAALRTDAAACLVVYEGAPTPPGAAYDSGDAEQEIKRLVEAGEREAALVTFLREVVGMDDAEIEAYRANPIWPARVAAAGTLVRELDAEPSAAAALDALGDVRVPVLQILGGKTRDVFRIATEALDARLEHGSIVVIDGARHAAHHTHPERFAAEVERFLHASG